MSCVGVVDESGERRRSWAEMRHSLHQLRRSLSSLSARTPHNFSFRRLPDRDHRQRMCLYFLSARSGADTQLCCVHVQLPADEDAAVSSHSICQDDDGGDKLPWQPVFDPSFQNLSTRAGGIYADIDILADRVPHKSCRSGVQCGRDDQLMLERKRALGWGVSDYSVHVTGRLVFSVAAGVFHVQHDMHATALSYPVELSGGDSDPAGRKHTRLNATMCPANPHLVAYVLNGDIWLANIGTGSNDRLTHTHDEGCSDTSPMTSSVTSALSAGLPSYVMLEEFGRFVGFWWARDCCADGSYRILYEQVDETQVDLVQLNSPQNGAQAETVRYPRAGTVNAVSSLHLVQFAVNEPARGTAGVIHVQHASLRVSLSSLFPWMEYMVRACWLDEQFVLCQLLDRSQCWLELVLVPVLLFDSTLTNHDVHDGAGAPPVQVLLSQKSDVWINVHDIFTVVPSGKQNQLSFIWLDEMSGFSHLVRIDSQVVRERSAVHCGVLRSQCVRRVPLTSGQWNVDPGHVWTLPQHTLVFFQGSRETPVERHLYVTSYSEPGSVHLLTTPGLYHTSQLNHECTVAVTVSSSVSQAPSCRVWRVIVTASGCGRAPVCLVPLGVLLETATVPRSLWQPQIHRVHVPSLSASLTASMTGQQTDRTAAGEQEQLFCLVYPPAGYVPGRRYPTVVSVYGGPQVQVVTNCFKGYRSLRSHILALHGYCVVAIDSRGSFNRGVQFEAHIKNRMGTVEIGDQVEALHVLADRTSMIDLRRVAVMGWSYGGYLSLMALAQRPDVFKLAAAGAPVVSWSLYDTGYTERYMDLPQRNPTGYEAGSVLSYVSRLPSEPGRLLLLHGLLDENVHFAHTQRLLAALIHAGKPYQLQVYPSERHSLRALESSEHYELTLLTFLNENL